ncbi:MAG: hypothetical protein CVU63_03110, partial [Deltaproteobacteria bacterium HGW-Deltaproteobacteria-20]
MYVEGESDGPTRKQIVELLADTRDVRARAAWVQALRNYRPGSTEPDIRAAARAVAEVPVGDADATGAMLQAFLKLEAGSSEGALIYLDIMNAMTKTSSPAWTPRLIEVIQRPMQKLSPSDRTNKRKIRVYRNEQFWQVTASEILGNVRSDTAARPLLRVVIDPKKADVAATAVLALVKIGSAATAVLNEALVDRDGQWERYTRSVGVAQDAAKAKVMQTAALVLGTMGRADAVTSLLAALNRTPASDVETRAIVARELAKCPATPESRQAVLDVLKSTPVSTVVPPGMPAVQVLIESTASLYDPAHVEALIEFGDKVQGEPEDKQMVRDAAMATMIKLMRPEQVAKVKAAMSRWAPRADESRLEKEALATAQGVLTECGRRVECYLAKVSAPAVQDRSRQFAGIKASYMIGMLGTEATAMAATVRLPEVTNAAVKFSLIQAIDHLAPRGNRAVTNELR